MDDDASKDSPTADFNKIDLSQLQGFSFGTQWAKDKDAPVDTRERPDRPQREDRGGTGGRSRPQGPQGVPQARGRARPERPARRRPRAAPAPGPGRRRRAAAPPSPGMDRQERGPYDSPYFSVAFFPEDTSFNALVKTIRTSARTIELFEIARTVLGKPERFVVVVSRKPQQDAAPGAAPKPIYASVPDGLPFDAEEDAVQHVVGTYLATFFDCAEVEVEPPKGNFQVINKCGVTGELLGPPNYHRYASLVQQHFAAKVGRMSFESFRSRIETVRDPEAVNQWLQKMKKVTRYTWKGAMPEGQPAPAFDSAEEARVYLLSQARDTVVKPVEHARFHGKALEVMPRGEILMAIEGTYDRQVRFPLDTANQLRGRLRREHFTIFKKGSKGVSYVCAVKRKFRVPGQAFAESIGNLIAFIEAHPLIKAGELGAKMLGIEGTPTPEQKERVSRAHGDLMWLVREGYVTEFIDGGLYAPPPMVEARKKEVESSEVDPENFPEAQSAGAPVDAPAADEAPAPLPAAEAAPAAEEPAPAPPAPQAAPEAPVEAQPPPPSEGGPSGAQP